MPRAQQQRPATPPVRVCEAQRVVSHTHRTAVTR